MMRLYQDKGEVKTPPDKFRINFVPAPTVATEKQWDNVKTCEGFPRLEKQKPHARPLAIVGGGPSVLDHIEELRQWKGDIWAVNNTATWLATQGIKAICISADCGPPSLFNIDGVDEAYLATCCHPEVRGLFKKCSFFDLVEHDDFGVNGGVTTATRAVFLSLKLGYIQTFLFGCEGSYSGLVSHAYKADPLLSSLLVIRCNGEDFITCPEFLLQTEALAEVVREAGVVFHDRSGGLLAAMAADKEWEIVAVSEGMKATLERDNGACGLFEQPYTFQKVA